jgi:hypothetical protein
LVRRLDAVLGDADNRLLTQVDEPDVRHVVGLEVAGIEAGPLGPEVVALRGERLGGLGILHDRADLLADHLGHDVVGSRVHGLVSEDVEDAEQLAQLPGRLEALPADRLAGGDAENIGRLHGNPSPGRSLVVPELGKGGFDGAGALRSSAQPDRSPPATRGRGA